METKKIIVILILFVFIIQSCSSLGNYYSYKEYNASDILFLEKDSSFIQYVQRKSIRDTFYGKWLKNKDTLLLKFDNPSVISQRNVKNYITESERSKKDSIRFYFYFDDTLSTSNPVNLIINKKQKNEPLRSSTGYLSIEDSIQIDYLYADCIGGSVSYVVKNKKSNLFKVYIYPDAFLSSSTRTNIFEKWLISKNILYPINIDNNEVLKESDYHLKKEN